MKVYILIFFFTSIWISSTASHSAEDEESFKNIRGGNFQNNVKFVEVQQDGMELKYNDNKEIWYNWEKTIQCQPRKLAYPCSIEEVQELVKSHYRIRTVGGGYSCNEFTCSNDLMINTKNLNYIKDFIPESFVSSSEYKMTISQGCVTAGAGVTIKELIDYTAEKGYTLPTVPFWVAQTIGGAVATGTHGTSQKYASLSSSIKSLKMVMADGSVRVFSELDGDQDSWKAAKLSLGLMGVIVEVTIKLIRDNITERHFGIVSETEFLEDLHRFTKHPNEIDEGHYLWVPHRKELLKSWVTDILIPETSVVNGEEVLRYEEIYDLDYEKPIPAKNSKGEVIDGLTYNPRSILDLYFKFMSQTTGKFIESFSTPLGVYTGPELDYTQTGGYLYMYELRPGIYYKSIARPLWLKESETFLRQYEGKYDLIEFSIPFSCMKNCFQNLFDALNNQYQDSREIFISPPIIRFSTSEDAFMSTAHDEPRIYINMEDFRPYQGKEDKMQVIKSILANKDICNARLHYGKSDVKQYYAGGKWISTSKSNVPSNIPLPYSIDFDFKDRVGSEQYRKFIEIVKHVDPAGKFSDANNILRSNSN